MSDEVNKNPVPRVVKGTGFYTPMDIAPGESPSAATPESSPTVVGEMVGHPTSTGIPPAATPPAASEPTQTSEGGEDAKSSS